MTTTPATRTPSLDGSNITSSKERDNDVHLVSSSRASTAAEPPHHHGPGLSKGRQIGIIVACTLTMMNNMGNGPSFTVTLPDLAKDLNITAANIQWVISAYSLTAVCILIPSQSTTFPLHHQPAYTLAVASVVSTSASRIFSGLFHFSPSFFRFFTLPVGS